jgi:hypothetical protein
MAISTLKLLLGLYPKTEQIENTRNKLIQEFAELNEYTTSEELARYQYLDKYVHSAEFTDLKAHYESLVFKNSDEEAKEKEYIRLKKWHEIKFYYKYGSSQAYQHFLSLDGTKEISDLEALKAYTETPEFKKVHDYMTDKKKWEKTDEFHKQRELEELSKNEHFSNYFKFIHSKEYADFKSLYQSKELEAYEVRKKYMESQEFIALRDSFDEKHFRDTDASHKYEEFKEWEKRPSFVNYFKLAGNDLLADFKKVHGSPEQAYFRELEGLFTTPEFVQQKKEISDADFQKTDDFKKYQEYQTMAASPSFKHYFQFVKLAGYSDFEQLYKSPEVVAYEARKKYIQSEEFLAEKEKHHKENFKKTDAYQQFVEFEEWAKQSKFKHYYALAGNPLFADYKKLHGTDELAYYVELETFVKSAQFAEKKKQIESLRFETTEEYTKLEQYKAQASSKRMVEYYKTKTSEPLAEYKVLQNSKTISDYEELEKYILSDEFKARKAYLLDTKKWEKTEEFKLWQEYSILKKSAKIVWYFKVWNSPKFDEIKAWKLVFEDDFAAGKLDRSKWITRYFWGEVLLGDTYALPGEKHLFTDGKNLEMNGSTVKIVTKAEKVNGKEWNPVIGFCPRDFDYSSGLICSGSSFRTKYGKIEAKIKFDATAGVLHAFWLAGEAMVPQIDVFKYSNNKLFLGSFWGNPTVPDGVKHDSSAFSASRFAGNYFIYSLEWSPEKIVWCINGVEFRTQTSNIPDEAMYVVLNSGVFGDQPAIPASMEIDWVRCYQKN